MKIGLPKELTAIKPVAALQQALDHAIEGVEWVHRVPSKVPSPRYLSQDACFPIKKILATCLSLTEDSDCLLVPRLVGPEGHLMCPNFRALPDLVSLNRDRMPACMDVPLVAPLIDRFDGKGFRVLVETTAGRITGLPEAGGRGTLRAVPMEPSPTAETGLPNDISGCIALLGHPYVLDDPRLNSGVVEILHDHGVNTVRCDQIPYSQCDRLARELDYFAKTLYWRPAREMLGAFLYFTRVRRPAGIIHLVPFNCGIEALTRLELRAIHRNIDSPPPYMVVVCDEHTQRDHVSTRVEAFLDITYAF